jgi:hypothetical protein
MTTLTWWRRRQYVGERSVAAVVLPVGTGLENPNRWVCRWGVWQLLANLVTSATAPTTLYSAGDRAHQPVNGWAPLIRARSKGTSGRWARAWWRST